ncbi:transferase family III domain [Cordyceps militaris]|uniref:Transferase family III domain n=1 Tax=Cordyceps militaris TaxID=73501 RepID=A0A2H4SRF5_CORMI|nr:transferase family III domain [Cordyceps militaris]
MTSPDRSALTTAALVADLWAALSLPPSALASLRLPSADTSIAVPSSFKIGMLAQASIALAALAAAQHHALRNHRPAAPAVTVPLEHARLEFHSQNYQSVNGTPPAPAELGTVGGLHRTADGHVRIHDLFPHHLTAALAILGLPQDATKDQVAEKTLTWNAVELETRAADNGAVIYALRTYADWDALPQASAVADTPILLRQLAPGPPKLLPPSTTAQNKALAGLRVVELTRVIAGPVAGRTLAAHGADVLWVTSPRLPSVPFLDSDTSRGKRRVSLDIRDAADKATLLRLLRTADVLVQSYRPDSLAAHGLSAEALVALNPSIIVASLSAFGPTGPWACRRGFDSLVQTATGMGAGHLLAAGVAAAACRRAVEGGAWRVDVSLAGTMKYLRSLGQYPRRRGFDEGAALPADVGGVPTEFVDVRRSADGEVRAVKHSAQMEGVEVGYDGAAGDVGGEPRWKDE